VYPDATFTREPTDSWYGEAVGRSMADPDADPLAELFLYTADHANHLSETVRPALADGDLVISDRYSDSRFAYQGATLARSDAGVRRPLEYVRGIHAAFSRAPDATIYLDLDPKTAAERAGRTDKFERDGYLAAVGDNYERLIDAEPDRFHRVDAARAPEDVVARVEEIVVELVGR
jgi:dTMP kinase